MDRARTFDAAVAHVLRWEGADSHDERGGKTRYGISSRAHPGLNISALSVDDAKAIYRTDYWDRLQCDRLPSALAVLAFDCAVNQGPDFAARALQSAVGVGQDGVVGEDTIRASLSRCGVDSLQWITVLRMTRYSQTAGAKLYLRGWLARALACYEVARSIA
jgi:lysozyme family protein